MLSEEDHQWLKGKGFDFEVVVSADGKITNLIIKNYPLPPGFDHDQTDLLVRLPAGFPDTPPDMFWVDPEIKLSKSGDRAPASAHFENYAGRRWQRFSRHLAPGAWRPGVDSLESWMHSIRALLAKDGST